MEHIGCSPHQTGMCDSAADSRTGVCLGEIMIVYEEITYNLHIMSVDTLQVHFDLLGTLTA